VIVVIAGPGGAGKGALVTRLLARDPRLWLSRSWTTRAPRPDEPTGWYHHVDRATFEDRVAQGGFLEWEEFLGSLYGTPTLEPPPGRDVLLEIELEGARQVKDQHPGAVLVFVVPPSRAVQQARLVHRGDPPERVRDRLDRAVEEVAAILDEHRQRSAP
jgi:guanylate kinase